MKYIFKQISEYGVKSESTVEFEADSLSDILEQFQFFLKGCGFSFVGNVDIVPEDEYNVVEDDYKADWPNDYSEEVQTEMFPDDGVSHSDHFYDTERNKGGEKPLFDVKGADNYSNFLAEYDREGNKSK